MTAHDVCKRQLTEGMQVGNMHACLRDTGRLAGGYEASGAISGGDMSRLAHLAVDLSKNDAEGREKWIDAVRHGRTEPVEFKPNAPCRVDRALSWDDVIGADTDYQVLDVNWIEPVATTESSDLPQSQIIDYLTVRLHSSD